MACDRYDVPIIHQDLRQEDTVLQIANALQYLQCCVDDILWKLETKVNEKKNDLQNIKQRTQIITSKIENLNGSKKATKVIASAKYPATDSYKNYNSAFENTQPLSFKAEPRRVSSKFPPLEKKILQEKLQFYHVKVSSKYLQRNVEIAHEEGLGSLPSNINSVTSLLLFNTSENPFKQYVMLDPLGTVRKTKPVTEDTNERLDAAPLSISQKETVKARESYFYSPGLGDVPQLDVPLDLPDLPGIADDLRYCMDSGPMIAPSVSSQFGGPEPFEEAEVAKLEVKAVVPEIVTKPAAPVQAPEVPQEKIQAPPPPPPPPPPAIISKPESEAPVKMVKETSSAADPRASLMEAIRQAGGTGKAKLRSAVEKKNEAKKKKQEMTAGGGDLMADLHAKLSMRRKGISGANKSEPVASAMEKVSAMIPPPPLPKVTTTEDESDWDC